MVPLVDTHCHLLAGLDDGPRTWEDVLAMCRIAQEEGVQMIAATAHQSERWNQVTPELIRAGTMHLTGLLQQAGIPVTVYPSAEVMAHPELETWWEQGKLLTVADRGGYLLLEMPHQIIVDLHPVVQRFRQQGVKLILAHPERHEEWLHEPGAIESLIEEGCLVQVSARSITHPANAREEKALKSWFRRGCVHLLGSDGHSPRKRQPRLANAYRRIVQWIGTLAADRICFTNGLAVLRGLTLRVSPPQRVRRWWVLPLW